MKVFIPGGNGFLGKRVIRRLEKDGIDYVSVSKRDRVDFRDFNQTKAVFEKHDFDMVINCSTFIGGIKYGYERPGEIFLNNILMSTNLIECSRLYDIKRFINPISNCSYPGEILEKFKEEDWWNGPLHESVLVYGLVRKASWVQAWAYHKQYGMNFINLILSNMYGPEDHFDEERSHALGALIMKFVEAKNTGEKEVVVWGTGKPIREWLYVDDAVEAIMKSLCVKPFIEPVNIGVGEGVSIKELAELIRDAAGYTGEIIYDRSKPDGAPCKVMDNKRCKEIFGWVPQTDLKDGITKTVDWYSKNFK